MSAGYLGRSFRVSILALLLSVPALCASAQDMVVVPLRVIYPGETISVDALNEVPLRRSPNGLGSIARHLEELDGKVARRTLLPGRLVSLASVREPYLVERGSVVTVTFVQDNLMISLQAIPLQSGAAGDFIKLRNIDSGAVITGVVMGDGTVRIGAS